MGQCNFYLKARFANAAKADAALPRLAELLAEGERAYDFWQDTRSREWEHPAPSPPPGAAAERQQAAQFWAEFAARFPLVCDYLGELVGIDDWINGLAGQLDLVDPFPARMSDARASLARYGTALHLQLDDIWHCADMRLLEAYCEDTLGATAAASLSEEDFEYDVRDDPDFDPFAFIDV